MKNPDRTTRIAYVIEAGFEYFISLFVTSTFLGYILKSLNFSDALQGIISTVATFTCGAQLFSIFLSGRAVKRITTIAHLINQSCFVLLYLLPIFNIPSGVKTVLLLVLLFAGHIINNAINPAKTTWLMTSVQNNKRGSFTAIKEMVSLAGGIVVSVTLGAVADLFKTEDGSPTSTYYVICCVAVFIMMLIHTVTLLVSTEKPMQIVEKPSVKNTLERMVKNRNLIKVILVGIIWNVASGLSASFYISYLREELAFTFTVITVISTVSSIVRILASPFVGSIADKKSFSFSMTMCYAIVAVGFLSNCFVTPNTRWLYLVYACLHGFAMAGINSGVINLIYDYVEPSDRTTALGIKNALGGIVAFFAALLSGSILSKIQQNGGFELFGHTLYAQQVLSFMSFAVTLLLIVYMYFVIRPLSRINEKSEPAEKIN